MTNIIVDKFNTEYTGYLNSELNTRLITSSLILTDKSTTEYYLNEYKRCVDEQLNFVNYINEQIEENNE